MRPSISTNVSTAFSSTKYTQPLPHCPNTTTLKRRTLNLLLTCLKPNFFRFCATRRKILQNSVNSSTYNRVFSRAISRDQQSRRSRKAYPTPVTRSSSSRCTCCRRAKIYSSSNTKLPISVTRHARKVTE